ncbi:protease modulator HflK [Hansschlegelia plantiphila]|uniref:Protease modulator HflK n=1 Tax=Hansschlegelia plantiphila TaxID=374655 RepID=A0A9W6J2P2_9HYPH|nr:protease modulator HflK [Hansschlegelia plantiphila]GLK68195.1 protease modulator HflK [Hansschlegelia plantiphila]
MPWSNQSGGGGGPWRGNQGGPWGQGPQQQGPTPPDLEDLLRRAQERFRGMLPGGGSGNKGILVLVVVALIGWAISGFYRVEADEEGIVLRFGEYVRTTQSGLNYHLPYPIESVLTPKVTTQNSIEVGMRSSAGGARAVTSREVPQESLMLTGDGNIVDVNFSVVWVIKPADGATGRPSGAANYLFNLEDPEGTIKAVAESAMREVVGRSKLQQILTEGTPDADAQPTTPGAPPVEPVLPKAETQNPEVTAAAVRDLMQKTLDSYQSGVDISSVQLQKIAPPGEVISAFREVQVAQADRIRLTNEAQSYANRVVPEARGKATQTAQAAEGYKASTVADAQGQASRFSQVVAAYKIAPQITRERLFIETMERVMGAVDKVIIDPKAGGQGVVPFLPLDQVQGAGSRAPRQNQTGAAQ